jgi:uncharacterized protein YodC (DUF2158 family)
MMTFSPNFRTGDVVRLNSGGPRMTVDRCDGGLVHCSWYDNNEKKMDIFEAATLQLVGEPRVVRGLSTWTKSRSRRVR